MAVSRGYGLWLFATVVLLLGAVHAFRTAQQAQLEHYRRLALTHSTIGPKGERKWTCCRPCPDGTVPMLHEAFEGDKNEQPKMKEQPSAEKADNLEQAKDNAGTIKFVELAATAHAQATAEASSAATLAAAARARAGAEAALTTRMTARALAQARTQARTTVERPRKSWYSCCNMCPDMTYEPEDHWYTPSPYSYNPRELFRLTRFRQLDGQEQQQQQEEEQEEGEEDESADSAEESEQTILMAVDRALHTERSGSGSSSSNHGRSHSYSHSHSRHRKDAASEALMKASAGDQAYAKLTQGEAFSAHAYSADASKLVTMGMQKLDQKELAEALAGFGAVVHDKKVLWQSELKGGALANHFPPPPPHEEKDRKLLWAPNLHDGFDLKTDSFFPPCCDFCYSTYFPHVINDELQLPTKMPFEVKAWGSSFAEVDTHARVRTRGRDRARAQSSANTYTDADADADADANTAAAAGGGKDAEAEAKAALAKMEEKKKELTGNSPNCCHKCIRKNLEDRDWRVFALPEDLVRQKKKHKKRHKKKKHHKKKL